MNGEDAYRTAPTRDARPTRDAAPARDTLPTRDAWPTHGARPSGSFNRRRDIEHFERWAPKYDRSWTQSIFFGRVHQGVTQVVATLRPAPTRILDIGCGTGALLRLLAGRFPAADLIGADASKEMLKMACTANPFPERLRFIEAQAEGLPFAESSFDLILSTISFHHWADQSQGLHEAARTLAPGGLFLLADHFVTPLQWVFFATPGRRKRFHSPAEIDEMLGAAGLTGQKWHDIHRIGPLLLINGVTADKAPVDTAPVAKAPV